jgi:hypothetical protein
LTHLASSFDMSRLPTLDAVVAVSDPDILILAVDGVEIREVDCKFRDFDELWKRGH